MPGPDAPPRRLALRVLAAAGATALASACSRTTFRCTEAPGLTPAEASARGVLGYADRSADPARTCDRCTHYVAAAGPACGSCRLVRGPVHPEGTCNVFAAKS